MIQLLLSWHEPSLDHFECHAVKRKMSKETLCIYSLWDSHSAGLKVRLLAAKWSDTFLLCFIIVLLKTSVTPKMTKSNPSLIRCWLSFSQTLQWLEKNQFLKPLAMAEIFKHWNKCWTFWLGILFKLTIVYPSLIWKKCKIHLIVFWCLLLSEEHGSPFLWLY